MSMKPHVTLVGAMLALTVLGCHNDHHYDETTPPIPITNPGSTEQDLPVIEGEDLDDSIDPGVDPKDQPQVPEAVEPGTDPKQAPPPSGGETKQAARG